MPPIHAYNFPTGTALHEGLIRKLSFSPADQLDLVTSSDVHLHNVIARAESFDYDLDIQRLWVNKLRWSSLVRQYVNPVALEEWLASCEAKLTKGKRGVSIMRTNLVAQQSSKSNDRIWRRWGSCILAVGYRAVPQPQITLHSRTSYLGYIAGLDLNVAHVCARLVGERVGVAPEEMAFVWHNENPQFHVYKSMAYLFGDDEMREQFLNPAQPHTKESAPGLYYSQKWLDAFKKMDDDGVLYGDMKFSQTRRIRKRWHTEVLGYDYGAPFEGGGEGSKGAASQNKRFKPLASVSTKDLDFSSIFRNCRSGAPEDVDMSTFSDEAGMDDDMLGPDDE
jgi:hypothetical protein